MWCRRESVIESLKRPASRNIKVLDLLILVSERSESISTGGSRREYSDIRGIPPSGWVAGAIFRVLVLIVLMVAVEF